jgi:hypothetical protein
MSVANSVIQTCAAAAATVMSSWLPCGEGGLQIRFKIRNKHSWFQRLVNEPAPTENNTNYDTLLYAGIRAVLVATFNHTY